MAVVESPPPHLPDFAPASPFYSEEHEAFRATVRDVIPLRGPGKVRHDLARPRPLPLQTWHDEQAALRESLEGIPRGSELETGEELSFVRDGLGAHILGRLRRGHWIIQDELDLHGLNSADARELLGEFLGQCLRKGLRCVRIIHGKGTGALRKAVREVVDTHPLIARVTPGTPKEGGDGVTVIHLSPQV